MGSKIYIRYTEDREKEREKESVEKIAERDREGKKRELWGGES